MKNSSRMPGSPAARALRLPHAHHTGRAFIGTSGYVYRHWRGRFYPADLAVRGWLPFYAARFHTVELNSTFYRLPERRTFRAWRESVPERFVFAVKASRFMTHVKRLRAPAAPLARLLRRVRALDTALGPLLFQLPERFHFDAGRLDLLLRALARQRFVPRIRAVLEVRHASWLTGAALERLERSGVALCCSDWTECPVAGPLTAPFVYLRRHGAGRRYGGSYPEDALRRDADDIRAWLASGRDVYVYFNNDENAYAARDAARLIELVEH